MAKLPNPISVRLNLTELAHLDRLAADLARLAPGYRPSRSAALRHLVVNSGSGVTGATTIAITEPPRGRDRAA